MTQRGKITLLLFIFTLCATIVLINHYLETDTARPGDLYAVVNEQLNAFRVDDFPGAYSRASTSFQKRFTVTQFADMIRADYSGIVNAQRVEFGIAERRGRHALIQVFFIDRRGEVTPCIYSLVSEGDDWKIDGARIMRRWPVGERLTGVRA